MVFKEDAYREVFPAQVETPVKPKTESMIKDLEEETPEEVKQVEQAQKEKPEEPEQESMKPDQEEGTNEL